MQTNPREWDRMDRDETLVRLQRTVAYIARSVTSSNTHFAVTARAGVVIDRGEAVALSRIVDHEPIRITDLARELGVGSSTASRQAEALCKRRLCVRLRHPDDRRVVEVRSTAGGRQLVHSMRDAHASILADLLRDWTDRELESGTLLLNRLASSLAKEFGSSVS